MLSMDDTALAEITVKEPETEKTAVMQMKLYTGHHGES